MRADRARSTGYRALEYYRRYGLRALVGRASLSAGSYRLGRAAGRVVPNSVRRFAVSPVLVFVDHPTEGAIEPSSGLTVEGWAWSRDGVETVELWMAGRLVAAAAPAVARPDVAAKLGNREHALMSGFELHASIRSAPIGDLGVVVRARDRHGRVAETHVAVSRVAPRALYHAFFEADQPTDAELARWGKWATAPGLPTLAIYVDARNGGDLDATLKSLASDAYPQMRIVRDADESSRPERDADVVAFLEAGEVLSRGATLALMSALVSTGADIVYADSDQVEPSGRHLVPELKPDWSPDHLLSHDYVRGFYLVRASLDVERLLAEVRGEGPAWRYDLLLRLTDAPLRVHHEPRLLWSEPARPVPAQRSRDELAAVRSALLRRTVDADVDAATDGIRHVHWRPPDPAPLVSIVIPTTGDLALVRACLDSLHAHTDYPNLEIVVVDNSHGRNPAGIQYARDHGAIVIERDEPFNYAKLNNDGVKESSGDVIVLLNDDVEAIHPGWLAEVAGHAVRPDIGAVGSLLLYPDGTIQHAGVILVGHGGGAKHLLQGLAPGVDGRQSLDHVTREVTANTGACLAVARAKYLEVGGFDEELAVVGNDIDLCLRLADRGYRNIWTPHSRLVHRESVSRAAIPVSRDVQRMWRRWSPRLAAGDRFYSPHFDQRRTDCALDWKRLDSRPLATAASRPAAQPGVNLVGYARAEMGLGEALRGYAFAMSAAHVPFNIIDYSVANPARMSDYSWSHKFLDELHFDFNVCVINADHIAEAPSELPSLRDGRYTIGSWTWELPTFPERWHEAFQCVDEVWVPSQFVHDAIAPAASVPVRLMPYAVRAPTGPFVGREYFNLPSDTFCFLGMYDVRSVRGRKNPQAAIDAFSEAFAADDRSVELIVKVVGADDGELELLRAWRNHRSNIRVIDSTLTRPELESLMATSDCFVSLHRSEGFGLPIAESMALGKPVIATAWSGNTDFSNDKNSAPVGYRLVTIEDQQGPYDIGQQWAEPDIDEAAHWMRRLRSEPQLASDIGDRARATIRDQLGPPVIGRLIAQRLAEIDAVPR